MCNYKNLQHYRGRFMKKFLMVSLFFSFATSLCAEDVAPKEVTITGKDVELGRLLMDAAKNQYKNEHKGEDCAKDHPVINNLDEALYFIVLAQRLLQDAQDSIDNSKSTFHFDKEELTFTRTDAKLGQILLKAYEDKHNISDDALKYIIGGTMHFVSLAQRMQECAKNPTDECNRFHLDEMEENLKHFPESETKKDLHNIIETLKVAKIATQSDEKNLIAEKE